MTLIIILGLLAVALVIGSAVAADDYLPTICALFIAVVIVGLFCLPQLARGRDLNGQYANAELKEWFDKLASDRGPCCSDADGSAVSDPDWVAKKAVDGNWHYQVRIDGGWVDVPNEALVTVPNKFGRTMVWPIRYPGNVIFIRCFMPGAMG